MADSMLAKRNDELERIKALIISSEVSDFSDFAKPLSYEQLVILFDELDKCNISQMKVGAMRLSNFLAFNILGWRSLEGDARRLWRDQHGAVVQINGCSICMQPWINGVNFNDDISFSPIFNYHRNIFVDWRKFIIFVALSKELGKQGINLNDALQF